LAFMLTSVFGTL